jgi:hypothetical protein
MALALTPSHDAIVSIVSSTEVGRLRPALGGVLVMPPHAPGIPRAVHLALLEPVPHACVGRARERESTASRRLTRLMLSSIKL